MENELARKVIDTVGQKQFQGDMVLAYLWNSAAALLGFKGIPSRKAPTEAELRIEIGAVLSRPAYASVADLQALRAA